MATASRVDSAPRTDTFTFLFSDIEGSASLWERHPEAMQVALAWHDAMLRQAIESMKGRVVNTTGDGLYAVFAAATDALAACLVAQSTLQGTKVGALLRTPLEDARSSIALRVRMGLHSGVAEMRNGDFFGASLNRAARIMSAANGEQILLSEATAELLRGQLPEGVTLREMGALRLKGLLNPEPVLQVVAPHLRSDFPPLTSLNAHSLPAERDTFVGRHEPLAELSRHFASGARLVSLLGPGGTGKTRLVTRFGWRSLGGYPGGVWFCDLAQAQSMDGIVHAVAQGLNLSLASGDPVTQIGHAIAGRGHCLVILDNFEQVVMHAPATLGRWMDRAVDAAFVATTRERLHLPGERVFSVEPLSLATEAIELFVTRAQAQQQDFEVNDANRAAVAEVVRLLDGLPLAIELAAARARVLSPSQIVDRMEDRFRLLIGAHGVAGRQATLRAAIDWSWDLLAPWEQAALAQFSVFEGGFTLVAAESVLDLALWPEAPSEMDVVHALVDKSLLRVWVPVEQMRFDIDEPHFGMYLSIHEYAADKLKASGPVAEQAAEERHGRYFAAFGTDQALESLLRHGGVARLHALALELDNLVAACRRAVSRGDADTAVGTYRAAWEVLELRGPFALGADLGARVNTADSMTDRLRDAVLTTRAMASLSLGRVDEAKSWLEQALTRARERSDRVAESKILGSLGGIFREQARREEAQANFGAAIDIAREVGNRRLEGKLIGSLASLHAELGRADDARGGYETALAISREIGSRRDEGANIANLGMLLQHRSRYEEARANYEASLAIMREVGSRRDEGIIISNLGILASDQGKLREARERYDEALAIHRELGHRREEGIVLGNLAPLVSEQGQSGEARLYYEEALSIARELGNTRHEGYLVESLGDLHREHGRLEEAQSFYTQALAIHRVVGNRRDEGVALGSYGQLLWRLGRTGEARETMLEGEAILRSLGRAHDLAKLLCIRGQLDAALADHDSARIALAEAESVLTSMNAGPESDLGRRIAKLRNALN